MRRYFSMHWPFSAFSVLESRSPIIRSESRTEDTSGLVIITARSAKRMASVCSALDAGGTIADHPVKFAAQFPDYGSDAVLSEGVLVSSLRGWQQPEVLETFV